MGKAHLLEPDTRDFPYACNIAFQKTLISEGWKTPNTYGNEFATIKNEPAVYLFALVDEYDYRRSFVGYVGMSVKLLQRITGHPVRSELDELGLYVVTWFKPTPRNELRNFERACIHRFAPPWNIIGKPRGVAV